MAAAANSLVNTFDFDSFFPLFPGGIDGEADLRRDILLLTSLLKSVRPGQTTLSMSDDRALSAWSHISYILSTGDKDTDKHGSNLKDVAVTGHLEPETVVMAAVVSRNASFKHLEPADKRSHPVDVMEVPERTRKEVRALMADATPDVPFVDHLADTAALIAYYYKTLRGVEDETLWAHTFYLFDFIVRHGYLKMSARLETGSSLWTDHPLVVMHDFYRSSPPVNLTSASFELRYANIYADLFSEHSLPPIPDETTTYVVDISAKNAAAWSSLLRGCYDTLLGDFALLGTTRKQQAKCPPLPCVGARMALFVLHDLLEQGVVEHLLVLPLIDSLNERYEASMKKFRSPLIGAIDGADPAGPTTLEYDADDLRATDEWPQRHVVRHMKALTIPVVAALRIAQDAYTASTVNAAVKFYRIIVTPDDPGLTLDYFNAFKQKLFDYLQHSGDYDPLLVVAFDALGRSEIYAQNASVHAEAALMSLVAGDPLGQEGVSFEDGSPDDSQTRFGTRFSSIVANRGRLAYRLRSRYAHSISIPSPSIRMP